MLPVVNIIAMSNKFDAIIGQPCTEKEYVSLSMLRDELFDICFYFVGALIFCFVWYTCLGNFGACKDIFWPVKSARGLIALIGVPVSIAVSPLILQMFFYTCAIFLVYCKAFIFRHPYIAYNRDGIFHAGAFGFYFTPWKAFTGVNETATPPIIGLKRRRLAFREKHPKYFFKRALLIDVKDQHIKDYLLASAEKHLAGDMEDFKAIEERKIRIMETISDWSTIRRREAEWKLFYPTPVSLNTSIVIGLSSIPMIAMYLWLVAQQEAPIGFWHMLIPAQFLLMGLFFTYTPLTMKRDKLPSVAFSRNFLAIKRAFMPGYFLMRWDEVTSISLEEKDKTRIRVQTKSTKPGHFINSYFPLTPQDAEQVLRQAAVYTPRQPAPPQTAQPIHTQAATAPKKPKSRIRSFFKKLLLTILGIVGLFFALLIYSAIDSIVNLPSHEELMADGAYVPYETFMRTYPDSMADTEHVILHYAFIYNGWLIEQHCRLLSDSQSRKLSLNATATEQIFTRYLSAKLQITPQEATNRNDFLQKTILAHINPEDCGERAEKIAYYAYYHSGIWERKNKAQPYEHQD